MADEKTIRIFDLQVGDYFMRTGSTYRVHKIDNGILWYTMMRKNKDGYDIWHHKHFCSQFSEEIVKLISEAVAQ